MPEFPDFPRRTALRTLAGAALAAPFAAGPLARLAAAGPAAPSLAWHPDPNKDGLKAFEGVEADRAGLHPDRKYVVVQGDHYRFNIWRDDRDSTGGGDRQRTEVKGMVQNGTMLKMHNGETWTISYEMFMPASLHGTNRFTHIFQTKNPSGNSGGDAAAYGPWVTLDLIREGGTEMISARAYANPGSPSIASAPLAPLREKWITVEWTLTPGDSGAAACVIRNGTGAGAPIAAQGRKTGVKLPDQGDYVRPKWGIYRSVESTPSDILDTYLMFRNYQAARK
ncbi:hypothetical protein [Amycolatopsis benzoatilytica]|uniref:hypothetical protein n=1 Tax=Amycolatopsis benzoatilytica TaxID=346045 RepID=UPI0003731F16|nr:hypothetical protein [Amycolatopsis benzoatilytica]